jgi:hypothetical protein
MLDCAQIDAFAQKVREYRDGYRHPRLSPLKVFELHTLTSWWKTPASRRPGCYAIFSEAGSLMYIGKASNGAYVGGRLAAHLRKLRQEWILLAPGHVQIVEVDEAFEAPSLEEFLIRELQPPLNDRGRRRTPQTSN